MFIKNIFTQTDPVADLIKGINETDYENKRSALTAANLFRVVEGLGKDIKRLATGKDVKSRAGQEIAKSQDASMKGDHKTSKKHFDRYDKLDKLANKEQGVAEGDDKKEWQKQNAKPKQLGKTEKYFSTRHTTKDTGAADKEQGVAEGSGGNWYIRVNGKILNDTKFKPVIFSSEDEARSHAMKHADKKRIPLSQMKLTKSWMDAPKQGVAEGWDDMLKDVKDKAGPQPSGGSGVKQGSSYGGSKQKDKPEQEVDKKKKMKKEEIDPKDTETDTLKGREKTSKNPFLSKKVMMDVPGNVKEELDERELSKGETAEKERIVKGMKKSLAGFKARYGKDAKSVMYATSTKQAKKD